MLNHVSRVTPAPCTVWYCYLQTALAHRVRMLEKPQPVRAAPIRQCVRPHQKGLTQVKLAAHIALQCCQRATGSHSKGGDTLAQLLVKSAAALPRHSHRNSYSPSSHPHFTMPMAAPAGVPVHAGGCQHPPPLPLPLPGTSAASAPHLKGGRPGAGAAVVHLPCSAAAVVHLHAVCITASLCWCLLVACGCTH
jgi:hypothetical protein